MGQMRFSPGDYDVFTSFCWMDMDVTRSNVKEMMVGDIVLYLLAVVVLLGNLSDARLLFSCSFKQGTCGMENQPGLKALWKRTYLHLGGRSGFAMVVTGNEASNHFARFLTPDFETGNADSGCLTFQYFIDGLTPASLACIKQGFVTKYVFASARKTQDHWGQADVDIQFLGDKVMFYFEADTKVQEYGNSIVAFTDVEITDSSCKNRALRLRKSKRRD